MALQQITNGITGAQAAAIIYGNDKQIAALNWNSAEDVGLTYPAVRVNKGVYYRVVSGQTIAASDVPGVSAKWEVIGQPLLSWDATRDNGVVYPAVRTYKGLFYRVVAGQTATSSDVPGVSTKWEVLNSPSLDWDAARDNGVVYPTTRVRNKIIYRVVAGQTATSSDVPGVSTKWENLGVLVDSDFNENSNNPIENKATSALKKAIDHFIGDREIVSQTTVLSINQTYTGTGYNNNRVLKVTGAMVASTGQKTLYQLDATGVNLLKFTNFRKHIQSGTAPINATCVGYKAGGEVVVIIDTQASYGSPVYINQSFDVSEFSQVSICYGQTAIDDGFTIELINAVYGSFEVETDAVKNYVDTNDSIVKDFPFPWYYGVIDTATGQTGSPLPTINKYTLIDVLPGDSVFHNKEALAGNSNFHAFSQTMAWLGFLSMPSPVSIPEGSPIRFLGTNFRTSSYDYSATLDFKIGRKVKNKFGFDYSGLKNVVRVRDFAPSHYPPGTNDSDVIDLALDFAKGLDSRTIVFDSKNWVIDRAILLPSNTKVIIDGVMIKQANQTFDNIFRGDNLTLNLGNPYGMPDAITPIENIEIIGLNGATIEGPDVNVQMVHPSLGLQDAVGDFWGWRTLQISFSLATNVKISGLKITKGRCWAISFDKCKDLEVRDIFYNLSSKNGDGIDFRSGCKNIKVRNIFGRTFDDTIALTALGGTTPAPSYPNGNYVYPMEPSRFLNPNYTAAELSIENADIENVKAVSEHHGVILLCAEGLQVFNVNLRNIIEEGQSKRESVIKLYTGYGGGYLPNDIHDVRISGVVSRGATYAFQSTVKVDDVWVNGAKQLKSGASVFNISYSEGITTTVS